MSTCRTCRHWAGIVADGWLDGMMRGAGDDLDFWMPSDAEESRIDAVRARVRQCRSPKLLFYVLPQAGEAAVVDGSGYKAGLCTDADFGCTNHEAASEPRPLGIMRA